MGGSNVKPSALKKLFIIIGVIDEAQIVKNLNIKQTFKWTQGHLYDSKSDKTSRMPNEQQKKVHPPIKKQDESTIEHETYENLLESPKSSTPIHERGQDRTSQPNNFIIEILTFHKETPPIISLASISCIQQNRKEEDIPQAKINPRKDKIHQASEKYIPPHFKKTNKLQVPRKQEAKVTVPLIPMKDKLQHYIFQGAEDHAIKNGEL